MRPRMRCLVGGGHCVLGVGGLGEANSDQDLLGRRIDNRQLFGAIDPVAAYENPGLATCLQLFKDRRHCPSTSMGTVRRSVVPSFHVTPTRW